MSDELKPVRCGCGGETEIDCHLGDLNRCNLYYVYCHKCRITSANYHSEAEAIEAWNKAMGAKDINVPTKERTAKVIDEVGLSCGNCDQWLKLGWSWCPKCGAKLEWK